MLSRSHRISSRHFKAVMEKGKIVHSSLFLARVLGGQTNTLIAAVAPNKVAKTAVSRNKIRRKIYAAIRTLNGKFVSNVYMIIFAKSMITKVPQIEIAADLKTLFVKAGLLR